MVQTITTNLTPDELSALIEAAVTKALGQCHPALEKKPEIIGREELCKRLNVTEPTVIRWEKKGKIPRLEIGTAIRYDWNRVVDSLQTHRGGKKVV